MPATDGERAGAARRGRGPRATPWQGRDEFRVVQVTPPGSACSIHFGKGATSAAPGSASGLWLVVHDIAAARAELIDRGIEVGEIFHRDGPGKPAVNGPDPQRRSYFSYATFSDRDGNAWLLQEVTSRFPFDLRLPGMTQ